MQEGMRIQWWLVFLYQLKLFLYDTPICLFWHFGVFFLFYNTLKQASNLCCAARGNALAIWHRYAPPRSARRPNALRAAQLIYLTQQIAINQKKCFTFHLKKIKYALDMNQGSYNTNVDGQQQYTNGTMYYPQYYYPQYTQAGTGQPMSVNFASNNKKDSPSTGLTVLKVLATLLFIALTVGIGILAWKAFKKADKTMDNEKETLNKTNEAMDAVKKNHEEINNLFDGTKKLILNDKEYTISLKDTAKATSQSIS